MRTGPILFTNGNELGLDPVERRVQDAHCEFTDPLEVEPLHCIQGIAIHHRRTWHTGV
jgi:hypothetical protein